MAYTGTDLANVKAAISALENGERAVSVSFGDKQFKYSEVDLDSLYRREAAIQRSLSRKRGYFLIETGGKGL